ncbi:hypothetical protein GCM10023340_19760 [Nocardioides marinquilinus]|uniref:Peptidoglycan binding domain-containing protein n=2 Tax=Nocardioides marinquilinus TaxID=1210400 RepID=A0ABP9PJ25_9ACTN
MIGRTVAVLAVVAAVALAAVLVVVLLGGDDDGPDDAGAPTGLAAAVASAPPGSQRLLWTDWGAVRAELGLDLDAGSGGADVQQLLDRGYEADLTSASALLSSAVVMQQDFGFSPATLDWELLAQSPSAASITMRLGGGVGTDEVAERLAALGYEAPADDGGLWSSDAAEDAVTATVTPELAFVGLDDERGLVVASDSSAGAEAALAAVADPPTGDDAAPVPPDVVRTVGDAVSAVLYSGAEACGSLAMSQADPSEQSAAQSLVARAGEVSPLTGFAIAALPGGQVRVAMGFETSETARSDADTRAVLASGPAPGQGGDFSDRFTLDDVVADGDVVRLDLTPVEGTYVVSDLSSGPVLFATCS